MNWDFDPVARWLEGSIFFIADHLALGLTLVFSLAGADRRPLASRTRYASSRARMDGLSLLPPLPLEAEELALVSRESGPDRESFLGGISHGSSGSWDRGGGGSHLLSSRPTGGCWGSSRSALDSSARSSPEGFPGALPGPAGAVPCPGPGMAPDGPTGARTGPSRPVPGPAGEDLGTGCAQKSGWPGPARSPASPRRSPGHCRPCL